MQHYKEPEALGETPDLRDEAGKEQDEPGNILLC